MPRKKAATQPGVAEQPEETTENKPEVATAEELRASAETVERLRQEPSARELAMQQIVEGRQKQLAEEANPDEEKPEEKAEDKPEEKSEEKPRVPTVTIQLDDGSLMEVPKSSIRSKVKIDGVEQEMNYVDIERGYQKDSAASKRLEEAAALRRQAEEMLSTRPSPDAGPAPSPDVQKAAESFYDSLMSENRGDAVKAIENFLRPRQVSVNEEDLAAKIERRLDGKTAGKWFKETYTDIVADENLFSIADKRADELLKENPTRSFRDVFQQAGDEVTEWLSRFKPKEPEKKNPPIDIQARQERKRQTIETVPNAGAVASLGEDAPRPQTHSQTIQDMKKARGQA